MCAGACNSVSSRLSVKASNHSGRSRKRSSESRLSHLFLCMFWVFEGGPHQSRAASSSLRSWAGLEEDNSCSVDVDGELLPELVDNPGTTRGTLFGQPCFCKRGAFCRGQHSSVGGVPVVNCLGAVRMEEKRFRTGSGRSGMRRARCRRDTRKGTRRGTEREQTLNQPHNMDDHGDGVMRTNTFLSHDVSVHHSVCALRKRKMTCEVYLSTSPSVTVDRHQL